MQVPNALARVHYCRLNRYIWRAVRMRNKFGKKKVLRRYGEARCRFISWRLSRRLFKMCSSNARWFSRKGRQRTLIRLFIQIINFFENV